MGKTLQMETVSQALVLTTCAACAIQFAVPESWDENRRESGDGFYCPNGHSLTYKGEIDKLRKQLASAEAALTSAEDQRLAAERSAAAAKGQVTKLKKRIANGICPCCHRSFANLHRHMTTQHPGYADD